MKFRYIIFLFIAIITLAIGINVQPASAQLVKEPTGFKNVSLWIYPEYDDSRLLVMLEGQISGATPPAQVRFLVPQTAEMYSAGSKDSTGKYTGGPPNRKASDIPGWDEISYTLTTVTFRVEYYDDIIKGTSDKQIAYDFRWLYPISDLRIIVQQPKTASNFTVIPPGIQTSESGFTVYAFNKSNLWSDPGVQPIHFDISYTKTDTSLSQPTNPIISTGGGGSTNSSSNVIPIVFIVLALIAVAVFMLMFTLKRKSGSPSRQVQRAKSFQPNNQRHEFQREKSGASGRAKQHGGGGPAVRSATVEEIHPDKFCDQCGQPVGKSTKFCSNCGNKLGASHDAVDNNVRDVA
jgi:hypothetical protein